jgi:HTH-type transcriptional regulator / antitoxin HigA
MSPKFRRTAPRPQCRECEAISALPIFEESPSTAELIRRLVDQHGLTRADMVPILGTPSRVSEVLRGKKELSMAMTAQTV